MFILTLDIVENCGDAYRNASDTVKKLMNQAIFDKFYIISNDEIDLDVELSFKPPFDKMIEPIKEDIAQINRNTNTDKTSSNLAKAKGHIQEFLECDLSDVDNPSNISTYPNNENFFSHNSLSKALLRKNGYMDTKCTPGKQMGCISFSVGCKLPQVGFICLLRGAFARVGAK